MKYPENLTEYITITLTKSELNDFIKTPEKDLIKYHFGLGMNLRNYYKLWKNTDKYSDNMIIDADEISFEFIKKTHKELQCLL